jgi:hypothetical protein
MDENFAAATGALDSAHRRDTAFFWQANAEQG